MTEVLAIIPARGGSKSIPRKNIKPFAGHPLIAYSIAAALQAEKVSRVIVSTDDPEIASVAREYGAEIPFRRPAELAQDSTPDLPVFKHALAWLEEHENYRPDLVVQLRPTTPVRPPNLIDSAIDLMLEHPEADSVRGVVPSGQNPYKMWRITEDGRLAPLLEPPNGIKEPYNAPRQQLPPTYWQTGHIDVIRPRVFAQNSMSGKIILPVVLDPIYTVDLDTPLDWMWAEWLVQNVEIPMVWPGRKPRPMPARIKLVALDFDGTLTDNRVWVDEQGREAVAANRGDGFGIEMLKAAGIQVVIISRETNPVVAARAKKLRVPVFQRVADKATLIRSLLAEYHIPPEEAVFVGNDINDVPAFAEVGWAVVVGDAHPEAKRAADWVLSSAGGHGAIRELADLLLKRLKSA